MDALELSVVIPCLNDAEALQPVIQTLEKSLQQKSIYYEVIVVDDGSQTPIQSLPTTAKSRWLRHEVTQGYGASLKTGIRVASGSAIMIIDSDGTYPAEDAGALYEVFRSKSADMVIGTRQGAKAMIPLARRPAKWILNLFAAVLVGREIPDLNSGFRIFKTSLFRRYETLFPQGFSFTSTLTFATLVDGFKVIFHPIDYRGRIGKSKIRPFRDTYNFFLLLITSALYFNPLRVFLPVSIFFFLLATFVLVFTKIAFDEIADITVTVLYMLSLQIGLLGFVADVIVKRSRTPGGDH